MGDPARNRHPEIEPNVRPDLQVIQGGGESSEGRGDLSAVNTTGAELKNAEREAGRLQSIDGGGESTPDRANLRAVDPSENINDVSNREDETPNQFYNPTPGGKHRGDARSMGQKAMGLIRGRKGATVGIFGGLGLIGFIFSTLLSPALLLVHVKNVFLNDLDDASSAISIRSDRMMRNMLKGSVQARASICTSKVTVRCKFSTMSRRMEKKFKKAGFEIEGRQRLGRTVVSEIRYTAKDGTTHAMKTPQDMKAFARTPEGRSALFKAFNPKTEAFLNSKFVKMLQTKFKLTKKSTEEGKNKKQVQESFDKATGADKVPPAEEGGRFKNAVDGAEKLRGTVGSKILSKASALSVVCPAYQTAYGVAYGIKAAKFVALASFAYEFFKETDKLVAGDASPEVVSNLGDQMTSLTTSKTISTNKSGGGEIDNPDYGKSPTDSQGYRLSAYGDTGPLNASTSRFSLGIPTAGIMGAIGLLLTIPGKVPGGKAAFKYFCRFMGSKKAAVGFMLAACLAGGAATEGVALAVCLAIQGIVAGIIAAILGYGLGKLAGYLIKEYGPMALGAATKGTDVGNAMAVGSGVIFGGMAQSNGMMPSKKGDLQTYFAYTDNIRKETLAANIYDAKSEPLNPYNQYSFAGGILQPLNASFASQPSIGGQVASLISTVTTSIAGLGKAGAAYNMPAQKYNDKRYSMCDDVMLKDANVDPDMLCTVRYSMSPAELEMDPDDNLDYMIENKHIDEITGEPISDEYKTFLTYCGPDREEMIGSTEDPFETNPWKTGTACSNKSEKMSNFRVYTMADNISTSFEEDPATVGTTGSQGIDLKVGTYNVRTGDLNNSKLGDPDGVYDEDDKKRMEGAAKLIKEAGLDIVGIQEARNQQLTDLVDYLPGYDATQVKGKGLDSESNIAWNTALFEKVKQGSVVIPKDSSRNRNAGWVMLKSTSTDRTIVVFSMHATTENDALRREAARAVLDTAKGLSDGSTIPVIVTGDMNSNEKGEGRRGVYDVFTESNYFSYTRDMASEKVNLNCDTHNDLPSTKPDCGSGVGSHIDHIWVSKSADASVSLWKNNATEEGIKYSDHNLVHSDITIPGLIESSAGSTFIIGTYNQKRDLSESQHSNAVKNIIESKMDVVGTQESTNPKYGRYKKDLAAQGYGVFPERNYSKGYINQTCSYAQAIFYNKAKFNFVKGDWFEIPRYNDRAQDCGDSEKTTASHDTEGGKLPSVWTHIPVVQLQDKQTGQPIIVINTHNVANVRASRDIHPSYARYVSAKIYVQQVQQLQKDNPGVPIFMTGDFNEGHTVRTDRNTTYQTKSQNLLYCMFKENGLMKNIFVNSPCNNTPGRTPVDAIYATPGVKVDWTKEIASGGSSNGPPSYSDHIVRYAQLTIPGAGNIGSGGISWPVDKKYWDSGRADFLDAHSADSGTWTSGVRSLAVDIGVPPSGSDVYAMLGGKVTNANLGDSKDPHGVLISTNIQGGTLEIAYAHGPRANSSSTYKAGDKIMEVGCLGNCDGAHLHIDMAFNGKGICPQDVFLAMSNGKTPDFKALTAKGKAPCGRL